MSWITEGAQDESYKMVAINRPGSLAARKWLLVFYLINRPLSPALTLKTPTQESILPVSTQTPTPQVKTPTVVAAIPAATQTVSPTDIAKICGNTGSMRLLVIGLTLPTDGEFLGADAIRLVTIDFDQPSATIMALPAWLWVDTPVLADIGVSETQLAAVYMEAYESKKVTSERYRNQLATQAIAQTIIDNFGFVPDHYITVDARTLIESVDTLGGIEINLPEAVDGTSEEYGIYPAGQQVLDGMRTLNFARLFHPDGVEDLDMWGNMVRQKLVVQAILAEALKPKNFTKIPTLMDDVFRGVVTDLSLKQTLDLVCMVEKVGESTQTLGVSEEMVTLDDSGRMIPDLEAIRQLIIQMDNSN